MGTLFTSFHWFFFKLIFVLPARYVRMHNFSGKWKQTQVVYTVNCSEYFLFVIYLLIFYSPFWNSFQWELVFYRNQSIHFFCTWSEPFISDMHFHWVEFTNSLEGYVILCVCFYRPAFAIIYLTAIRFSIIEVFELSRGFPVICFRCWLA